MGKYIRKSKLTGDVSVMEAPLSQSPLGVRTRAKTLALKSAAPPPKPDTCYLELRSRRLEKPPLLPRPRTRRQQKPPSSIEKEREVVVVVEKGDSEIEASFGENVPDSDPVRESRSTRESTPCSLIGAADTMTPPGSTTKRRSPTVASQRGQNEVLRNVPTARELEEFFADAEKLQQRRFIEKYNFDIVNDVPLPGRYEWVKVMP